MDTRARIRATAEAMGAVAAVLSLVFVGMETRQNRVAVRAATAQDIFTSSREYIASVVASRPLMELYVTVQNDPSVVDTLAGTVEGLMLNLLYQDRFNALDNAYYYFRHGPLDAGMWMAWRSWLDSMAEDPGYRGIVLVDMYFGVDEELGEQHPYEGGWIAGLQLDRENWTRQWVRSF